MPKLKLFQCIFGAIMTAVALSSPMAVSNDVGYKVAKQFIATGARVGDAGIELGMVAETIGNEFPKFSSRIDNSAEALDTAGDQLLTVGAQIGVNPGVAGKTLVAAGRAMVQAGEQMIQAGFDLQE